MLPRMSANPVPEQSEKKHEDTKAGDLASILERPSYRVVTASSGEESPPLPLRGSRCSPLARQ